jgi:ABC-2 type transport system permease protein
MLWYKAWRETRARFLVCLALMLIPVYNFLTWKKFLFPGDVDGPQLYFKTLFEHHVGAAMIWLFSAVLLGLGGIVTERATGSSSLTLSLPVSRLQVVTARAGVGILEAVALALVPWLLNCGISAYRQTPFSISQAASCFLLLAGGGMVCFTVAILVSSLVEAEYTAAAVSYGVVILSFVLSENIDRLRPLNIFALVTGLDYIDKHTYLFNGALPWPALLGSLTIAAAMLIASVAIVRRTDF